MSTETVCLLIPEIVLIAVAVLIYVAGAFVDARREWSWIAGGGIVVAAIALAMPGSGTGVTDTAGPVTADSLAGFGRWLALACGGLFVLLTSRPLAGGGTSEYVGSLLLAVAGLMLVAGADELVLMFLGLELISIPTYILLYLGRRDAACQESAAKYFFLSIFASAMLLYGFAFLYGTAGSTHLPTIRAELIAPGAISTGFVPLLKVAFVLILAGLAFKIAAVPFHFYAPDVYQGTTQANAAVLSVIPKAAGLIALVRILVIAVPPMPDVQPYAWRVVAVLAVATMTLGNLTALWQDNLRRLLAYSSIAHAGYMLIALAVALAPAAGQDGLAGQGGFGGVGALLFYFCVYAAATIGTFAALDYLGRRGRQLESVEELAGLGRTRPLMAAVLAVFMFSLAGIPVLAGFWGKLAVFAGALGVDAGAEAGGTLRTWFVSLAIAGVLNAAVAAAYYLRIVARMYFRTPLGVPKAEGGPGAWWAAMVCAVLTIGIGILPGPLMRQANRVGRTVESRVGTAHHEHEKTRAQGLAVGNAHPTPTWDSRTFRLNVLYTGHSAIQDRKTCEAASGCPPIPNPQLLTPLLPPLDPTRYNGPLAAPGEPSKKSKKRSGKPWKRASCPIPCVPGR